MLFHAGTQIVGNKLVTASGRVFTAVGLGESLSEAITKAYKGVESVQFQGMVYRKDIGFRCLP
jgi:phosphoribosylamine-glycine ligase